MPYSYFALRFPYILPQFLFMSYNKVFPAIGICRANKVSLFSYSCLNTVNSEIFSFDSQFNFWVWKRAQGNSGKLNLINYHFLIISIKIFSREK